MGIKRRRVAANNKEPAVAPSSMSEVPKTCLVLRDWINDLYASRHGASEEKAWPVGKGGSFQEVVQRCFNDSDQLLADSLSFAKSIGLLGRDADLQVFAQRFLVMKDIPRKQTWIMSFHHIAQRYVD